MKLSSAPLKGHTILLLGDGRTSMMMNDLLAPLILQHGGRVLRVSPEATPGSLAFQAGFRGKSMEEMRQAKPAAAILADSLQGLLVPASVPTIGIPHATTKCNTLDITGRYKDYLKHIDFYFTQDDCTTYTGPLPERVYTYRGISEVVLTPIGSLKRDSLARVMAATPQKDVIMVCGGSRGFPGPSLQDVIWLLESIRKRYPEYLLVYRPFPEERDDDTPIHEHFANREGFVFDLTESTAIFMARTRAHICFASSTGWVYSMASGEPHIQLSTDQREPLRRKPLGFTCNNVADAFEALGTILSDTPEGRQKIADMRRDIDAFVCSAIYRPGQAENLFISALLTVIRGETPQPHIRIPTINRQQRYAGNILKGLDTFDSHLTRPEILYEMENTSYAYLVFFYLYKTFLPPYHLYPVKPRLMGVDKTSVQSPEEMFVWLPPETIPPNKPIILLGSPDNLTKPGKMALDQHPGGYIRADDAAGLETAIRLTTEDSFPIFLCQDTNEIEVIESFSLLIRLLRSSLTDPWPEVRKP